MTSLTAAIVIASALKTPHIPLWITKEVYPRVTDAGMMAHNTKIVSMGMYVDFNGDGIGADVRDRESIMQEIRGEFPDCWSNIKSPEVIDTTVQTTITAWKNFVVRWK